MTDKLNMYQPKGGMCGTCAKWRNDCSKLPFDTMPVIKTTDLGVKVVRCSEYVRSGTASAGLPGCAPAHNGD